MHVNNLTTHAPIYAKKSCCNTSVLVGYSMNKSWCNTFVSVVDWRGKSWCNAIVLVVDWREKSCCLLTKNLSNTFVLDVYSMKTSSVILFDELFTHEKSFTIPSVNSTYLIIYESNRKIVFFFIFTSKSGIKPIKHLTNEFMCENLLFHQPN
jgi:hypothetical protein